MYAIGYIVYGVPLSENFCQKFKGLTLVDLPEIHSEFTAKEINDNKIKYDTLLEVVSEMFFETVYSGSGFMDCGPGWCGVQVGEFDEAQENILLSSLTPQITSVQKAEALAKIAKLPAAVRAILPEPDVYIVWGTS